MATKSKPNQLEFDFIKDAPPQQDNLERVIKMCEVLASKKDRFELMENELKKLKKDIDTLEQEEIPMLMQELNMKSASLFDGTRIDLVDDIKTSIPAAKRAEACRWLIDNGYGGLVKIALNIEFQRGDYENAQAAAEKLITEFDNLRLDENVHHSTLRAFVKERLEAGENLPENLFGIHQSYKVKLTK